MEREKDFYGPAETAKALGISERQVFGMLCSGELDGQQDALARWWVPAGSIERAQRGLDPSSGADEPPAYDVEALTTERGTRWRRAPDDRRRRRCAPTALAGRRGCAS